MGKKSLAALLCATMAMTACMLPATAAMADEPLKIEFFQQKGEEGPQKGYKEIIDKFNKENSDIEIEMINPDVKPAPQELQDKHYFRKHGANAYYGQPGK